MPLPKPHANPSAQSALPAYLQDTYSWVCVVPEAVRCLNRQWLMNLMRWGNFLRLRNLVLDAFGERLSGRSLLCRPACEKRPIGHD